MFTTRHLLSFFVPAFVLLLTACSPRAVREAQEVVAEADSLRTEGQAFTDSVAIAEAYNTLEKWQHIYPTDYARACYYYGRLLRAKDDPVSAMQVFINATHTNTRDFHILGRVYANVANMCRIENAHELSYKMYECSAEKFLQGQDSVLYFYALNNMAYELAEQAQKEACIFLLDSINRECSYQVVLIKTLETRAELYEVITQHDSAIYYVNRLFEFGYTEPTGQLIMAQAYSNLGINDSAIFYASRVLTDSSASYQNRFNALYIISHHDSTLKGEDIRDMASQREDIRYYEYEPEQEKLLTAVQMLEQDLTREPDWRWWLITALIFSFAIISFVSLRIWRRRKQMMEIRVETMVNNHADDIITSIKQHIDINDLNHTLHWKNYSAMKSDADLYMGSLVSKLEAHSLNEVEIRLCILTELNMSLKEIAENIHYGYPSGIKTLKKRTAVKLGTTPPKLKEFLFKMMTNSLF